MGWDPTEQRLLHATGNWRDGYIEYMYNKPTFYYRLGGEIVSVIAWSAEGQTKDIEILVFAASPLSKHH